MDASPSIAGHMELTDPQAALGILSSVQVPYLDHQRPLAFAHRGGAAHGPENSWTAFEYAVKLGYAYLETDARATSDGKLMAFHDRTLDRVTDATGPIGARSYADLREIKVAGEEPIPLIEDLLGNWPDVRFNIDLKDEPGISLLPEILNRTGAWNRVCVTSFSGTRLRTFRGLVHQPVCMAVSPASIAMIRCSGGLLPGAQAKRLSTAMARCAQIPGRLATRTFIRRAHALGLQVHVWTINDSAAMHEYLDRGADGIMTDRVEVLRDVLTARGQWTRRGS
jgi:glycerophosphoryl diester phosphodiesterase